jgi:hypothetical protein
MSLLADFPPDMYCLRPGEEPLYGAFPDLKKSVQWFIAQLLEGDWLKRREAVTRLFYQSLVGERADLDDKGRFFNQKDMFG